ncbi:MAG: methyltransferase domain-containing protein [Dehalococcoidia bacterium]
MLTVDYSLLGIQDGERILDIGCGTGRHSWEACRQACCNVYALDIDGEELLRARGVLGAMDRQGESRGQWGLLRGSTLSLPFKEGVFDKVVCSEVLEHVPDDVQSIKEMARVLKDRGIAAVSVPSYLPEAICWRISSAYHARAGGHVRIYRSGQLIPPLSASGLHVYATRRKHALHSFYWILRCLFGVNNEKAPLPSLYHRFLVWDMKTNSRLVRWLDSFLNLFFAKSMVLYATKNENER